MYTLNKQTNPCAIHVPSMYHPCTSPCTIHVRHKYIFINSDILRYTYNDILTMIYENDIRRMRPHALWVHE